MIRAFRALYRLSSVSGVKIKVTNNFEIFSRAGVLNLGP